MKRNTVILFCTAFLILAADTSYALCTGVLLQDSCSYDPACINPEGDQSDLAFVRDYPYLFLPASNGILNLMEQLPRDHVPSQNSVPLLSGYLRVLPVQSRINDHYFLPFTYPHQESPSPVPEPATLLLLGAGMIGIARKRKGSKGKHQ